MPRHRSLSGTDIAKSPLVLLEPQYPGRSEPCRSSLGLELRAGNRREEAPHQTAGHLCGLGDATMCRDGRGCLEISLSFGQIRIAEDSVSRMTLVGRGTTHSMPGYSFVT